MSNNLKRTFIDPLLITFDRSLMQQVVKDPSYETLKQSLKNGLNEPLTVEYHNGEYRLNHGYRRLKAVIELIGEGETFKQIPIRTIEPQPDNIQRLKDFLNGLDNISRLKKN